jgi:hypothetical protein
MAIGDDFVLGEILPYQLAEMCDVCRLSQRQVSISLKKLCTAVLNNLGKVPLDEFEEGDEMNFAQDLTERIKANALRFLAFAEELPRVRL